MYRITDKFVSNINSVFNHDTQLCCLSISFLCYISLHFHLLAYIDKILAICILLVGKMIDSQLNGEQFTPCARRKTQSSSDTL